MWGFCVIVLTLWVFLQVAVGSLIFFPSLFCTFPKTSWEDKTDSFILCNNKNQLTLWLAVAFLAYGWRSWIDGPQKKSLTLLLWWFGTLICWHQMKQTQWGKKEDKSDRGSDWGEKKAVHESGWKCVCVCVCKCSLWGTEECSENLGWDSKPEERQNVWMHLRMSRDKKGSSGVRGLLLGLLIPRPSHPFRACLRSGSLALCVDDPAPPADLICYVFLLPRLPSTSTIIVPERDPHSLFQGAC